MSETACFSLLLVDDEPKILSALTRLFHRYSYRIVTASSGIEALKVLEKEPVAVVVSDMNMPLMNGAQFLTLVSQRWPDIERIVLTGQADLKDTISAINSAGIFRYINKPWDEAELLQSVSDAATSFLNKANQKNLQQVTLQQNQKLKNHNTVLKQTVEHKLFELEKTNDKLASAFEGEKRLRAERNKAEQRSEAKSRFLATMSHEIRSPLNAVIAMNALLLESELSDDQRELAKIAHDGGRTLLALINDILDFSKFEAGNLKLSESWFSIVEVVQNVVELMASHTIDKEVEILTVFSPNTPALILGDENRVRQILTNLINNAVKFTKEGGVIVRIQARESRGIDIDVEDTGIGIHDSEKEKIFDEFVQADDSESRAYGGTGLGLSICRQLISLMGGSISLKSQVGRGSNFNINLPCETKNTLFAESEETTPHLVCIEAKNKVLISGLTEQLGYLNRQVIDLDKINTLGGNFQSYTFITNIEGDSDLPASYENHLKSCLEKDNPTLLEKNWKLVGLVSNDGIGKLKKTKSLGFSSLLRKPIRLSSIIDHMIPENSTFEINEEAKHPANGVLENTRCPASNQRLKSLTTQQYQLLLVEDSEANQAIVKAVLKSKNFSIDIANNGVEALQAVAGKKYHAILMDISMPMMDGITATKKIRMGDSVNKNTVIIAMTAKAFAEDQEQCMEAGVNDYISKPIDVPRFVSCLENWLENGTQEELPDKAIAQDTCIKALDTNKINDSKIENLVDFPTLERLVGDTSKEVLPEILAIYFNESEKRVSKMLELYQRSSWQLLSDQAHALKSSSGSFGAKHLQKVASEIELHAAENKDDKLIEPMQTLASLSEKTISALRAYCDNF